MTFAPDGETFITTHDGVRVRVLDFRCRHDPSAGRVLFVPGFLSFIESWELVLPEVCRRFHVHYFESREKRSSVVHRHSRFRLAELIADLEAVIRHLGLRDGEYHMVASCGGAATVLQAFAQLTARPAKMVWVAPSLRTVLPAIIVPLSMIMRGPLHVVLQRIAIAWYRIFLNPPTKDAFQHSRFMDVVMRADPFKATRGARDIYGLQVEAELARAIPIPVLVLAASQDESHRFADSVLLARLLPAGHLVDLGQFWRTRAPAAGRAIAGFLA